MSLMSSRALTPRSSSSAMIFFRMAARAVRCALRKRYFAKSPMHSFRLCAGTRTLRNCLHSFRFSFRRLRSSFRCSFGVLHRGERADSALGALVGVKGGVGGELGAGVATGVATGVAVAVAVAVAGGELVAVGVAVCDRARDPACEITNTPSAAMAAAAAAGIGELVDELGGELVRELGTGAGAGTSTRGIASSGTGLGSGEGAGRGKLWRMSPKPRLSADRGSGGMTSPSSRSSSASSSRFSGLGTRGGGGGCGNWRFERGGPLSRRRGIGSPRRRAVSSIALFAASR